MRIAPEGRREIVLCTTVLGLLGTAAALWFWPGLVFCAIVWLWVISFFRDPERTCSPQSGMLIAPADGTVTEITRVEHEPHLGGPALRIGIFLSIFNVHINRIPCSGTVRKIVYAPGLFLDARHPESGSSNESNTLWIDPEAPWIGPVIVRQVAGKIARRIVCHVRPNDTVKAGERLGMIKFGSRTELILPLACSEPMVRIGQTVMGGTTIIARQFRQTDVETSLGSEK